MRIRSTYPLDVYEHMLIYSAQKITLFLFGNPIQVSLMWEKSYYLTKVSEFSSQYFPSFENWQFQPSVVYKSVAYMASFTRTPWLLIKNPYLRVNE